MKSEEIEASSTYYQKKPNPIWSLPADPSTWADHNIDVYNRYGVKTTMKESWTVIEGNSFIIAHDFKFLEGASNKSFLIKYNNLNRDNAVAFTFFNKDSPKQCNRTFLKKGNGSVIIKIPEGISGEYTIQMLNASYQNAKIYINLISVDLFCDDSHFSEVMKFGYEPTVIGQSHDLLQMLDINESNIETKAKRELNIFKVDSLDIVGHTLEKKNNGAHPEPEREVEYEKGFRLRPIHLLLPAVAISSFIIGRKWDDICNYVRPGK